MDREKQDLQDFCPSSWKVVETYPWRGGNLWDKNLAEKSAIDKLIHGNTKQQNSQSGKHFSIIHSHFESITADWCHPISCTLKLGPYSSLSLGLQEVHKYFGLNSSERRGVTICLPSQRLFQCLRGLFTHCLLANMVFQPSFHGRVLKDSRKSFHLHPVCLFFWLWRTIGFRGSHWFLTIWARIEGFESVWPKITFTLKRRIGSGIHFILHFSLRLSESSPKMDGQVTLFEGKKVYFKINFS